MMYNSITHLNSTVIAVGKSKISEVKNYCPYKYLITYYNKHQGVFSVGTDKYLKWTYLLKYV